MAVGSRQSARPAASVGVLWFVVVRWGRGERLVGRCWLLAVAVNTLTLIGSKRYNVTFGL